MRPRFPVMPVMVVAALALAGCRTDDPVPPPEVSPENRVVEEEDDQKPQLDKGTFDVYRTKADGSKDPTYPVAYAWRMPGDTPSRERWAILEAAVPAKGFIRPGKDNDETRLLYDWIPKPGTNAVNWHHTSDATFLQAMKERYDALADGTKPPRNGTDAELILEKWVKE